MTKYYDATVDGWQRIAVVAWDNDEQSDSRFGVEIDEGDLPEGFGSWTSYERYAHDDCTVEVVSLGGN